LEKLLVTGQSGFIGSHLTPILSKKYQIVGLAKKKLPQLKILQLKYDIQSVSASTIPKNVNCIVHMAALANFEYCNNNPSKCFSVNVGGTQNLLEIARKKDLKFLYVSTGHVFGTPEKLPINERHPRNPSSIYAKSKLEAEILCESYSKSYGIDVAIVRLFSVYGPKSPDYLVTSKIISQLLTRSSIRLGNVHPKRDFVYIDDAIDAIEKVLPKIHRFNSYNVGSGKSYSILEICNILSKISGKKIEIKSLKARARSNEIENIVADISKIKKLGWKPKVGIREGLKLTYEWYKSKK